MHVILDISRLLFSVHRAAPSGIDRVEMAYARRWLARPARECTFVAQSAWGGFAAVPREAVAALVEAVRAAWEGGGREAATRRWRCAAGLAAAQVLGAGRTALRATLGAHRRPVFLLVSHRGLDRAAPIMALRRAGAAFVPLIHDLIPLTHPEYARPPQVERHARRVAITAALADGILVNSAATEASLRPHLAARGVAPPLAVAPLGLDPRPPAPPAPAEEAPRFVCLGTIEPRKNHLLLLHLWREFAARPAPGAPRLLLLGRRGWENENILDLLDRCGALRGLVQELGTPSDAEAAALLAGSRALLFPSFAEGYGLPLAEALALGVPAICSDIPALREVGGAVPEFLDPLDGAAWRRAVLDYAAPESPRRAAQLARLAAWRPPSWEAHFAAVEGLLERVAATRAAERPLPVPPLALPGRAAFAAGARPA
ncbi:glycosyltransferase family 4 protein [Crenalkalicoccus roseus]|uniref:glycosyltransferase family 4 protein n=1 Tax=Crenalkalicoccus roseus TaxID=1485588 RepID=UPI001F0182F1|nr:glycosyltransferase family 1 protein [Crenalkalicoccus roseus]